MESVVIFGGTGFIGTFFAKLLLQNNQIKKIYIYDIEPLADKKNKLFNNRLIQDSRLTFIEGDVRNSISWLPPEKISLIANFAAVHREPGHDAYEYYETNLLGAENICAWAESVDCQNIIFTSSISPYGPSEEERTEKSLPSPTTAYGSSKLAAEKIHQIWQAKDHSKRNLVITRPGVVFGPSEGGNVSRLIQAVIHRYFFYMGNENTRKAGTYVKELCNAMLWVLEHQKREGKQVSIFNMSMNPGPSIKEYADTICKVAKIRRSFLRVPYRVLLAVAFTIDIVARPLGINHPFSPVRIRKLTKSNNILPGYLVENGYVYQYDLEGALNDWKKDCPEEWT